jgi:hypothetical protein
MFAYQFRKLVDTDPECWISTSIRCEPDEQQDGTIVYRLYCDSLYTRRKEPDETWTEWADDELLYATDDIEEMARHIGYLHFEANNDMGDQRVLRILRCLVLATMAAG